MSKQFFKLKATLQLIGELEHIKVNNSFDLYKKTLTLETPDNQVLFPEIRNNKIKILDRLGIVEGDAVEVEYCFQGSEKNGKRYNNIYVQSIKKI